MDQNNSYWASTINTDCSRTLEETITADIAVIGAGLLGLSAAYHINRLFPEKKIIVLEAAQIANGASGRNGGQLMALNLMESLKSTLRLSNKKSFPKAFLNLWNKTLSGIDLFQEIIDRHAIECEFSRDGSMALAATGFAANAMGKYVRAANDIGIPLTFLNDQEYKKQINATGYFGGIYYPGYGRINPARYVKGLADALQTQGVDIYENSPVIKTEPGVTNRLSTPKGTVSAETVILATNAYTPELGFFKNDIAPLLNPCSATTQLSPEMIADIGWNSPHSFHDSQPVPWYLSLAQDNRIIIGGGASDYFYGGKTDMPSQRLPQYKTHFRNKLLRLFPQLQDTSIDYVWAGAIDASMDLAPSVGRTGDHHNIYYGIGFSGEGVNQAHLSGKIIADLYADNAEPWQDLFFVNRLPKLMPVEPVRYAALKTALRIGKIISR